jgi:hypothetical protein
MFLADLDDAKLLTEFTELISCQRLRQDISKLLLSADVFNVQFPSPTHSRIK